MSHKRLNLDPLWHYLRPALSTPSRHIITAPATQHLRCPSPVPTSSRCLRKHYSSSSAQHSDDQNQQIPGDTSLDGESADGPSRNKIRPRNNVQKGMQPRRIRQAPNAVMSASTKDLEDILANRPMKINNVMPILNVLIRDRRIRPEARHYKSLIQCNTDPLLGSPLMVRKLLMEMDNCKTPMDSGTLHAALQALAVHPDYILRQDVLRALRDRWLPLSPDGWHYVVAGLIREHQFELALDHMAHMERKDIVVEDWLHSLLIYYLCEVDEFGEILELMDSRLKQGHKMTKALWMHVLEEAVDAYHHDLTRFIWTRIVEFGHNPPETNLCRGVIRVAEHAGDKELAASVSKMLQHSDSMIGLNDYETLSNARLNSEGLYAAFETLCDMQLVAGHVVQPRSTQAIRGYCMANKIHPRDAWKTLKELHSAGKKIPLECTTVVIELCEEAAADDPFAVDDGIAFYGDVHILCGRTPDLRAFNTLIGMSRSGNNTDAAMFFVKEMAALGILPDVTTFEHLMIMCVEAGNFESAYLYFEDFRKRSFIIGDKARTRIRDVCKQSSDAFAVKLRHHPGLMKRGKWSSQEQGEYQKVIEKNYNKERRKRKRRALAIARTAEDEDWKDYEPSLVTPKDLLNKAGAKKD
ncbi:hypothetical protein BJX76DRAFT_97858 [Aspergillus varians]